MRNHSLAPPNISLRTLKLFHLYARWYMHWHLSAVRVSTVEPPRLQHLPVIVCMNHPSWWDPLVAMTIALRLFPERRHYAPMDAKALAGYQFFERLGFFGVDPGTPTSGARFLSTGSAILSQPDAMLWVTAQGAFRDVRERPVILRSGLGHLVRHCPNVAVLPVAIEYAYGDRRLPEALVRFGDPIIAGQLSSRSSSEWTHVFAQALEVTQDRLAESVIGRDPAAFQTLAGGRVGVGGIYGGWKWLSSKVRRQPASALGARS